MPKASRKQIIEGLNQAVGLEFSAAIQLLTHASFLEGFDAEPVIEHFKGHGKDELDHAEKILHRIWVLEGKPDFKVTLPSFVNDEKEALRQGIKLEDEAVKHYRKLMKMLDHDEDTTLYETIENLLEDEQSDLEAFIRLLSRKNLKR